MMNGNGEPSILIITHHSSLITDHSSFTAHHSPSLPLPFLPKYSLIHKVIPITETDNPNTSEIDKVSTLDAVRLINNEDKLVAAAVEKVLPEIAVAIDKIVERLQNDGRLFYIGTGTSGRLA